MFFLRCDYCSIWMNLCLWQCKCILLLSCSVFACVMIYFLQLDAVVIFDQREWKNTRQKVLPAFSLMWRGFYTFLWYLVDACCTLIDHISIYFTVNIVHMVNNRLKNGWMSMCETHRYRHLIYWRTFSH